MRLVTTLRSTALRCWTQFSSLGRNLAKPSPSGKLGIEVIVPDRPLALTNRPNLTIMCLGTLSQLEVMLKQRRQRSFYEMLR
jgi:hypothetical protein